MPSFVSDQTEFAYLDEGTGEPVLLVHGFASNRRVNWVNPGWIDTLTAAGRRAIAIDNRGHGDSAKFYRPEDYRLDAMAGDLRALMDHLGIERADIMGYSMGARIAATFALAHGARLRSLVLGGMGSSLVDGLIHGETIAAGLEADSVDMITDPEARAFRQFADQTRSDRAALAACMRCIRSPIDPALLAGIHAPTLIAVGTRDRVAGSARDLAALIPGAEVLDIPGRDHMVAVGDQVFKRGVVDFLARRP